MNTLLDKDDPRLRQIAEPVAESEFGSSWLKELVHNLFRIMQEKRAVGMAAPQIGINKRVIVLGTSYTQRQNIDRHVPDTALINPSLKILSKEIQTGYEGCLNCGEIMGEVPRAMNIEYSGFDVDGTFIAQKASGFEARILQHEVDHLNGYLFLDRIENEETLTTKSELFSRINL